MNLKTQAPIDVNIPPHKLLEVFFDDEMINCLCDQSKIYVNSKGNFTLHVTPDELRAFLAILLISGYTSLQRRRVYWEQVPDVFNYTVSDMLTRNRFEEILRYLHLADNAKLIQGDKLAKVRPFYIMMNQRFLNAFQFDQQLCVDKSMIPYFGKHSAKQYIKGKPIKFGYKLWCLNTNFGYLIQCDPYSDKGDHNARLGLVGSVVARLFNKLPSEFSFNVTFDNLFTSLHLLPS